MATSIIGSIQVPRDTKVTIDVDTELSPDSQNPIANSAVYEAVQKLQSQIEDINSKLDIIVVDELPTQDIDANAIYLVPLESEDEQNKFTEYIYVDSKWEKIGTYNSSVDLSQYLTKVEAESTYVKQTDIPTHLPNPEALTIKYNGTITFTYDGSTAETGNFIVNAETVPLSASDATTISNKLNTLDSKLADLEDVYSVNLTDLLAAEDSGSISTAIGGIDNLNAAVTKNQNIIGTVANGKVSVSIRNLGKVTSLYYILDTLAGYTVNEINITNTDGTLSKTVVSHSMMTEEMVIDNLTTSQSTLPLSANQGKILNETKQNILVSGTNIKTINGNSLLGEGNIEIQGGGSGIADAPSDDKLYGRKNANWSEIPSTDNFATKSEIADMLTKTEAASTYQPKGEYATTSQLQADLESEAEARKTADEEIKLELKDKVKYTDVSDGENPNRKTIQLNNHDTISGLDTSGVGYNLAMVSKWNVADFGTSSLPINLNGSEERPTYNDDKEIALLEDVKSSNAALEAYKSSNDARVKAVEDGLAAVPGKIDARIQEVIDAAPETLDTLNELAAALGDDPNFATTITNQIGSKQDSLVSGVNIKTINGASLLGEGNITIETPEGGISDAPQDGNLYGRKNGEWSEVVIPTVPTKTSQLENDSNFIASEQLPDVSDMLTKTEASGTYQIKGNYLTSVPQAGQDVIGGIKVNYAESDKNYAVKLDGEGRAYVTVNWTSYSNATVEQAGLMSKDDKSKLDKIPEGASKVTFSQSLNQGTEIGVITINDVPTTLYAPTAGESVTYGQATDTSLGLVKIGYTQNGTNYPVQLDGDGKMFVSVTESSDLQTLKEQVAKLMAEIFPLSLTASGGGNYEQGTSQTVTITWNLTQGGDQVTPDSFTINNEPVTFSDKSKQYTQVTTNTTYVVKATVGDETLSKTLYARFYSPRYWGVVDTDFEPTEATIKGLQKLSISSSRSYSRSGISLVEQKICYAYPKSFGALTAIKDGNNFDNLGSYAQSEITVDGVAYYVYLMKDPVSGDGITQNYS